MSLRQPLVPPPWPELLFQVALTTRAKRLPVGHPELGKSSVVKQPCPCEAGQGVVDHLGSVALDPQSLSQFTLTARAKGEQQQGRFVCLLTGVLRAQTGDLFVIQGHAGPQAHRDGGSPLYREGEGTIQIQVDALPATFLFF
jgi:hypothetical protein